ncbi:OLC1v1030552C1 [Oldenlandia corymbosa var. corymbosa]|uniref:OLC1v1030552C1 n=1 Tax=Oldenlandia corymbosa var. corymbosa TaxID=529605 RepID=A0AAV1CHD1_OLDCO|nr:OLC1v1030552C1 [Oldenlandia corymbosa var. corymbosa]
MEEGRWESPVAIGGKETPTILQISSKVQPNPLFVAVQRDMQSMLPNQSNQNFQISNEINLHDPATNPVINDQSSTKSTQDLASQSNSDFQILNDSQSVEISPSNPATSDPAINAPAIPQSLSSYSEDASQRRTEMIKTEVTGHRSGLRKENAMFL